MCYYINVVLSYWLGAYWGSGDDRVPAGPVGPCHQALKVEFIALLDVQEQAFGSDMCQDLHTFCKGRAMLQSDMTEWDVFRQLPGFLLEILLVIA